MEERKHVDSLGSGHYEGETKMISLGFHNDEEASFRPNIKNHKFVLKSL